MTAQNDKLAPLDDRLRKIRYSNYSDVMFILAPFIALLIHNIWSGSILDFFTSPYLSILNAALAGLAISKYVQCLALELVRHPSRPKAANMIGFTTLFSFIPSLILAVNIHSSENTAELVTYIQFSIFILTLSIYFSHISFINKLTDEKPKSSNESNKNDFPEETLTQPSNE